MHDKKQQNDFIRGVLRGLGISAGLALGMIALLATALIAGEFFQFSAGDLVSADQINNNFSRLRNADAPVGSIVAWHRDLTGAPGIPAGWKECDGSAVTDTDSPFNGQIVPDLNGQRLFLRGNATSGGTETDAFQAHGHSISPNPHSHSINWGWLSYAGGGISSEAWLGGSVSTVTSSAVTLSVGDAVTTTGGAPRTSSETRPANMAVIWIIRIK